MMASVADQKRVWSGLQAPIRGLPLRVQRIWAEGAVARRRLSRAQPRASGSVVERVMAAVQRLVVLATGLAAIGGAAGVGAPPDAVVDSVGEGAEGVVIVAD